VDTRCSVSFAAGVESIVVAPSLIPAKPGERIKTNRRDARRLAQMLRADALTEVHPPTPEEEEAVRDLSRCSRKEQMASDLSDLVEVGQGKHRLALEPGSWPDPGISPWQIPTVA
jgi:transposase